MIPPTKTLFCFCPGGLFFLNFVPLKSDIQSYLNFTQHCFEENLNELLIRLDSYENK